jgi:hypothetical protein
MEANPGAVEAHNEAVKAQPGLEGLLASGVELYHFDEDLEPHKKAGFESTRKCEKTDPDTPQRDA